MPFSLPFLPSSLLLPSFLPSFFLPLIFSLLHSYLPICFFFPSTAFLPIYSSICLSSFIYILIILFFILLVYSPLVFFLSFLSCLIHLCLFVLFFSGSLYILSLPSSSSSLPPPASSLPPPSSPPLFPFFFPHIKSVTKQKVMRG